MARGKHYSKESEIGRQCGNRFEKKHYNNDTRLRLKYKLAKSIEEKNSIDASESIYLRTPHGHLFMHSSSQVLIIAMVCCMVYQLHISTNCNVFRTVLPDLFVPFLGFVI